MQELNPLEWAIRPVKKYAVFSGRAPRAEYWWYTLATAIIGFPVDMIDEAVGNTGMISGTFNLALLVPGLAVTIRRLHDTNRSGWWLVAFIIPIAAVAFVGAAAMGTGLEAMNFPGLGLIGMAVAVITLIVLAVVMFVFMVLPGTAGPNDYGPDPYGPNSLEEVFA